MSSLALVRYMSVIGVRVDRRIREILERAGINIGAEVKRFLEKLAWKVELKERVERLNQVIMRVPPAEKGFSQRSVREDRGRD